MSFKSFSTSSDTSAKTKSADASKGPSVPDAPKGAAPAASSDGGPAKKS